MARQPGLSDALTAGSAYFQLLKDGAGDDIYDEYAVMIDAMPPKVTPETFL